MFTWPADVRMDGATGGPETPMNPTNLVVAAKQQVARQ
jgi:hypothetical protein